MDEPNLDGHKKAAKNRELRIKESKQQLAQERAAKALAATTTALTVATPAPVERLAKRPTPEPEEKNKLIFETLNKIVVLAKASEDTPDKSRLEALVEKAYLMAMGSNDLDEVLGVLKFVAERLEGKPTALYGGRELPSSAAGHQLTVNIGTRFSPSAQSAPEVEVLSITEDK